MLGYMLYGRQGFVTNGANHIVSIYVGSAMVSVHNYTENPSYYFSATLGGVMVTITSPSTIKLNMGSSVAVSGTLNIHLYITKIKS